MVVHLLTGEQLTVQQIVAGPGADSVTLDVYAEVDEPEGVLEEMIEDVDGERRTTRVVTTNLHRIDHIELLHDRPRSAVTGFRNSI